MNEAGTGTGTGTGEEIIDPKTGKVATPARRKRILKKRADAEIMTQRTRERRAKKKRDTIERKKIGLKTNGEGKLSRNVGDLKIYKGRIDGIQYSMWDAVPQCTESCPIYETCQHPKIPDGKCSLRIQYIHSTIVALEASITEKNDFNLHKFGMLLLPLYQQLVTFKIHALKLDGEDIYTGTKINPVYKEIRETVKMINSLLKDLVEDKPQAFADPNGSDGYYEQLIENAQVPVLNI